MFRTLLLATLLAACGTCLASEPSDRVENFLSKVATPEADAAFDGLFAGSRFAEMKPQEILTLKSQTKMAMGLYGAPLGVEKIEEIDLSPSVKRLVYVQKFADFPVAWEFYFYRARDEWSMNTIQFKDQIASILDSSR